MNILRFCVASNKKSLKWTGVRLFGVTFDKVPTGFIRIHAGKNPNTSSIRHKMGLQPPRVLTSFMHVSWYRAASMSNLKLSFLILLLYLSQFTYQTKQ